VRNAHLAETVDFFRRIVLRETGIDDSTIADWDHEGFKTPSVPDALIKKSWVWLRKYNMPLTVFLQQPLEWVEDMEECEAMYNTMTSQATALKEGQASNAG
jgi:hypothetical protein